MKMYHLPLNKRLTPPKRYWYIVRFRWTNHEPLDVTVRALDRFAAFDTVRESMWLPRDTIICGIEKAR